MRYRTFAALMIALVLLLVAGLKQVHGEGLISRVTYYTWTGQPMYTGIYPFIGAAACSWNLPLYTRIRFPNGEVVTCLDRGLLYTWDTVIWVDVYGRPDLHWAYDYDIVEVIYP